MASFSTGTTAAVDHTGSALPGIAVETIRKMKWTQVLVGTLGFLVFYQTALFPDCSAEAEENTHHNKEINVVQPQMMTNQSSVWSGDNGQVPHKADRAINGNLSECAHTLKQENSWWRIDLQGLFQVSRIYINNTHNTQYNLRDSVIYIGNSTEKNGTLNTRCGSVTKDLINKDENLTCDSPIWGRYVSVNLKEHQYLILCEVKIYGTKTGRWTLVKESKPWDEALYHCRDQDMDLVSVLNANTQAFVGLEAQNANTPFVWLGLHYTCTLGFWFWVADHRLNYSNWDPPHGSNLSGCDTSAAMATNSSHYWYTKSDHEVFNFICE